MKIPNVELQQSFFNSALRALAKVQRDSFINAESRALFDACVSGPRHTFRKLLKEFLLSYAPDKFGHYEDNYQNYIFCVLQHGSSGGFNVVAEMCGGHGRSDILIEEIKGPRAVIIELKASKSAEEDKLKDLARAALKQIQTKRYRARLSGRTRTVREYGVAVCKKHCHVISRCMKRQLGGQWKSHSV